ncbi:MotE family protein [Tranquillimonas alkanivorans]|uniref:Flagellar motility protein MotE, a chaperone for MotC folding n=1 Tax=Tranquillimonas alkanivorans TaxID=441119 RepID=A0A1I5S3X7_9RHOB|nr:hypothetical protein [Tranquillimonas alkanivorans]SFP65301.1 Flagellar motility protein MotE, a chaperone for MotC folding [Tranquillimonas alkanivorans]
MSLQPMRLMIGTLAFAGLVKAGMMLGERPELFGEIEPRRLFGAAEAAAPSAPQATAETLKAAAPESCPLPEEMFEALAQERDLLADQKERLSQRRAEIELANEKLRIETRRLEELKVEVEGLLARVEQAQTADVDRLVALYRNMKPKEAAGIMNDLDIEVTVMVLGTMSERDAAPIMAAMSPVRARAISKIILERSKLPGDQDLNGVRLQ